MTYFLFLQGAHDNGTLFLFLTTRYCASGEYCPPALEAVADGGVGVMMTIALNLETSPNFLNGNGGHGLESLLEAKDN